MATARLSIGRYLSIRAAVGLLSYAGLFAQGVPPGVEIRELTCCGADFTLDHVLKATRALPPRVSSLRLTKVTPDVGATFGYPGVAGAPWSHFRKIVIADYQKWPPIAYVLDNATSRVASFWNPKTGDYIFRKIRGSDLFHLEDGSEIVYLIPGGTRGQSAAIVCIWAKGSLDIERSARLSREARKLLGLSRVDCYIATTPFFWQSGICPMQVPALGELGAREIEGAQPALEFRCDSSSESETPVCRVSKAQFR